MAGVNALSRPRFPFLTVLLVLTAGMLYLDPDSNRLFIYDRGKIFDGELWRLFTGHLVHLSREHFTYNVLLFSLSGGWVEYRASTQYYWLLSVTAFASSLYFLFFLPDMAYFAGLSGLISANVVFLLLLEIQRNRNNTRPFWIVALVLLVAKIVYEIVAGKALFIPQNAMAFEVVPSAHIIGAVVAAALFVWETPHSGG